MADSKFGLPNLKLVPKLGIPSLACPILRLGRFQVLAQQIQSAKWILIKCSYHCTDLDIVSTIQTGEATLCDNKAFIGYFVTIYSISYRQILTFLFVGNTKWNKLCLAKFRSSADRPDMTFYPVVRCYPLISLYSTPKVCVMV